MRGALIATAIVLAVSLSTAEAGELGVNVYGLSYHFDRDLAGDSKIAFTTGVHFHPSPESVLKLDYRRDRSRDRFHNPSEGAAILMSLTSYF